MKNKTILYDDGQIIARNMELFLIEASLLVRKFTVWCKPYRQTQFLERHDREALYRWLKLNWKQRRKEKPTIKVMQFDTVEEVLALLAEKKEHNGNHTRA